MWFDKKKLNGLPINQHIRQTEVVHLWSQYVVLCWNRFKSGNSKTLGQAQLVTKHRCINGKSRNALVINADLARTKHLNNCHKPLPTTPLQKNNNIGPKLEIRPYIHSIVLHCKLRFARLSPLYNNTSAGFCNSIYNCFLYALTFLLAPL